jgi:hypothetical protein
MRYQMTCLDTNHRRPHPLGLLLLQFYTLRPKHLQYLQHQNLKLQFLHFLKHFYPYHLLWMLQQFQHRKALLRQHH